MHVLWHKVRFDLWHNRRRTLTAILSIAAGLFAIGGIFGMVDQLLAQMDSAHRAVNPSHINIIMRDFAPRPVLESLETVEGVAGLELMAQVSVRYRRDPADDWQIGLLLARDFDAQDFDTMALIEGQYPAADSLAVERLSGAYFGLTPGDSLTLDAGGASVDYTLDGVVRHPFVEPPAFGGSAHFFSADLTAFGVPAGLYNQLLVQIDPYSDEAARAVAADLRAALAARGLGVVVTLYQEPDAHWGRMFVEGITVILQVMAGLSLLMSLALVTNTFTALLTQQTDQIGILKALGSRRRIILTVYLSQVLAIGLIALALSLPPTLLFVYAMNRWFLDLFNIQLTQFTYSPAAVALQVGAAFVAPLLAALPPIWRATTMSVRAALSTYGIGQDYRSNPLDRLIERGAGRLLPTLYAAALGNLLRRKGRLLFTVSTLTLAGAMFLIVTSLADSIYLTLDGEQTRQRYDVEVGFNQSYTEREIFAIVDSVGLIDAAQMWYLRNALLLVDGVRVEDSAGLGTELAALPDDPFYQPIIVAGRWIEPGDGRVIVLSADTAARNGLAVGDTVTIDLGAPGRAEWQIVGLYRVIYGGGFVTESVFAPRAALFDLLDLTEPQGTRLYARTGSADLDSALADARRITDALRDAGLDLNTYVTRVKLEERAFANNQFASTTGMLYSVAMLVATIGGIGLSGALSISVMEQTREIGVMRSVGARSASLFRLYLAEGLLQALFSWALAIPLALLAADPLARLMGQTILEVDLDFSFAWWAVLVWLLTVLIIAAVATIYPARAAARISVRDSLSYA